jgi:TetR/AcrR family transcriptional regulator, transcriptional repressor for nem operon
MYLAVQMKRAVTNKGKATRQRIVEAAADLLHQRGVRGTSPNDVMAESRTGKSQFYHYFDSKLGLVHAVLAQHTQAIREGTAPIRYEIGSWEDLARWFRAHAAQQEQFEMKRGCPFGTIGNGLGEEDELLRQDLALLFEVVRNKLAAFFVREKARGQLANQIDEAELADFCITSIQGAMLLGKVRRDRGTVDASIGHTLSYLERLRARPASLRKQRRGRRSAEG